MSLHLLITRDACLVLALGAAVLGAGCGEPDDQQSVENPQSPAAGAGAGTGGSSAGAAGTSAGSGGTIGSVAGMNGTTAGMAGQAGGGSGGGGAGGGAAGAPQAGTGGSGPAGGEGHENAVVDPVGNANRAPGYIDLSPPMGEPLPEQGVAVTPAPPAGWTWHTIDGAICRDGSPTGLYVHEGTADGLLIYLEGGGACSNGNYCAFNPASVDQVLAGDGEVVIGSALGAGPGRQQPGVYTDATHAGAPAGIFDTSNAANPFKDWSQIYIPYCTGDVHFGTKKNGMVPNEPAAQQFVGYYNMRRFIGRIVPTFKDRVSKVVIAGSSAGGFGAALNYSMVQDAFGEVPVAVLDDSGPPFENEFMPVCMQQKWRAAWGLTEAMPPDCDECRAADGGGMIRLANFLMEKHPDARIAMISSMEDEVIRLFYSVGLGDCGAYETADPVAVVLLQADPAVFFPAPQYTGGLNALRSEYNDTGRFASYFIGDLNVSYHQHLFRPRFYEAVAGGKTIAQFTSEFVDGMVPIVGP
jgi:hypothetical protein